MRAFALAAATAALALMGVAEARPWADPAGRLTFDAPAGWAVNQPPGSPANLSYVIAGNANNECQFLATTNSVTAAAQPARVRTLSGDTTRFNNDFWTRALASFTDIFRAGPPLRLTR